jgi:hypothetical protein
MSTWVTFLDLILTSATLMFAFAYIVKRLWVPQACQSNPPKKSEIIIGTNLANALALVQKKKDAMQWPILKIKHVRQP